MPRRRNRKSKLSTAVRNEMRKISYSTQEKKHHRVVVDGTFSSSGTAVELNTVDSQGVASGQFVGQQVRQIGIRLRGKLTQSDGSNVARVMIASLTQLGETELNATSVSNLFYDPVEAIYSPHREPYFQRVFKDFTTSLNIASGQNDKIRLLNMWIPLQMKRLNVNEATNPLTSEQKIYIFLISDSDVVSHPAYTFHSNLMYVDA